MKISGAKAGEVLDSRGAPTVECTIRIDGNLSATAIVPSGMSTGTYEALELRDGGRRYNGKGVLKAVGNVNTKIGPKIKGMDPSRQEEIDGLMLKMDGTKNKSNLGANAILAVSLAIARAGAMSKDQELFEYIANMDGKTGVHMPVPFANIINGGVHAGSKLRIQEFMIAPVRARDFSEGTRMVAEIYHELKEKLKAKYGKSAVNVGDEGGFAPPLEYASDAMELIQESIDEMGYAKQVRLAMDAASSEFFKDGKYELDGKRLTSEELTDYYIGFINTYKLVSLEDPFQEDAWQSFAELNNKVGSKVQIVGDDLTVTNVGRIKKAVSLKAANCLLLKVNQIGSLTESIAAANMAYAAKWNVMVSHRSGETDDAFISDLSVALDSKQIKLGAPARGERTAKYNRLLRIEEMLGPKAKYGWVR